MRTATHQTRTALRQAIAASGLSRSAWARANGLRPTDVSDVFNDKSISLERENGIRRVLSLFDLTAQMVEIDDTRQVVARPGFGPPRSYVERKVRLSPDDAARLDDEIRRAGFDSFSQYWKSRNNGHDSE